MRERLHNCYIAQNQTLSNIFFVHTCTDKNINDQMRTENLSSLKMACKYDFYIAVPSNRINIFLLLRQCF